MKETIFNDIYNQYQPDKELVNRLMERVKNEKPKAVPFKAVITIASAAAGLALCFAAWKLLPSGPNIEVVNPAVMTTTTTTYKSSIITNTDPILTLETPPGATTAPCYGPWDETTTTAYETTTATNSSWEETVPTTSHDIIILTDTTTVAVTETQTTSKAPETTTVTVTSPYETTTVTQAIITTTEITTLPPVTETEESKETEEEVIPEVDTEIAIDDEAPVSEDLPIFNTLGEYYDFFDFEKVETARISYETRANGFISFNFEEMDIQLAEETALSLKDCVRNDDAPLRGENNEYIRKVGISINDTFSISICENGTIKFSAKNYKGTIKSTADPSLYDKLYEYAMSIDGDSPIYHVGESNDDSDSVDEVEPEYENPITADIPLTSAANTPAVLPEE